ncbi:GNAT family N-acetyltransferase [Amycolatopsis suaedae]|uniref:GNAT family N-acetyltransferase n=2 Tax=Amycolatopsis suaedae TaxID=2510978 RepID=A0A4Q7JAZ1_9PSEU|nr:GNAT family N-acetyltransferase [Amycolatopsis suaedae]
MQPLQPSEDRILLTAAAGGSHAAGLAGLVEHSDQESRSIYHPLREYQLAVRIAGDQPDAALSALLTQWDDELAERAEPGDRESAAVVLRPSRDTAGTAALLEHGFAPIRGIAVRPADRLGAGSGPTPGVYVRAAGPEDLPTVTALGMELLEFDSQFGVVNLREVSEQMVASMSKGYIRGEDPSIWIAEVYGQPLGVVTLQLPPSSDWARPYVAADKVGYINSMAVSTAARGTGVGTALTAHTHQIFDEAGVDVALLHHALANPRSTPFWYSQGYRPLWTYWYRRPAVR